MAGALLNIKLNGNEKLQQRFGRLEKAGKTVYIPMKRATIIGYKDIIQHFQEEAGPQAKWKSLKFRKGKILQDTGRLRMSISFRTVGNTGNIGTNIIYGATHQFGRDKIPARPYLWFSERTKQNIKKELMSHLEGK